MSCPHNKGVGGGRLAASVAKAEQALVAQSGEAADRETNSQTRSTGSPTVLQSPSTCCHGSASMLMRWEERGVCGVATTATEWGRGVGGQRSEIHVLP